MTNEKLKEIKERLLAENDRLNQLQKRARTLTAYAP